MNNKLKIGYIGLGKMGSDMVERLLNSGYEVVVLDRDDKAVSDIDRYGAIPANSLQSLSAILPTPRVSWLMIPYQAVDVVLGELIQYLSREETP